MDQVQKALDQAERLDQLYLWAYGSLLAAERLQVSLMGSFDTPGDKPRGSGEHHLAVTFDQESFVRALDHLLKAQSRLSKADRRATEPPRDLKHIVKLLRNAYEHWPTERRRDGSRRAQLAALYPDSEPWSLQWDAIGLKLGGVLTVEPTLAWAREVKEFAATRCREAFDALNGHEGRQ